MQKSLILIGGRGPDNIDFLDLSRYGKIIAADSGYDLAKKLNIKPDIVVGDFDSTEYKAELLNLGFEMCPRDKDDSDFTLALRKAKGEYDLLGGGEGRLDHLISIFSTFLNFSPPTLWLTKEDAIFSSTCFKAEVKKDSTLSFFPASLNEKTKVSTSGLVWDLNDDEVSLSFLSLSNRARCEEIEIRSEKKLFIRFDMDIFKSGCKIISC